jgi:hypothetical protein
MRLLRHLAAISIATCVGLLLLLSTAACGPRTYQQDRAYRDLLNPQKIRDRKDEARLQKQREALAVEMDARAAALESAARDAKAKGSSEAAEKSAKQAAQLREQARKVRRGDRLP